jgi:hypothetical protein
MTKNAQNYAEKSEISALNSVSKLATLAMGKRLQGRASKVHVKTATQSTWQAKPTQTMEEAKKSYFLAKITAYICRCALSLRSGF